MSDSATPCTMLDCVCSGKRISIGKISSSSFTAKGVLYPSGYWYMVGPS